MHVDGDGHRDGDGASETFEKVPLERLDAEISELAAHLSAAMCRWLKLVVEFDRREGHVKLGFHCCSTWLAWRCSIAPRAAREHVRVARRLRKLPLVERAFSRGELSYSKVRALTRMPDETQQPELLEFALHATAAQLDKVVRTYRRVNLAQAKRTEELRHCSWSWDEDGSLRVSARLAPDEGALFLKALEAGRANATATDADDPRITNADAFAAIAESALAATPSARSGGDAYQVVVHVDPDGLRDEGDAGVCHLENGPGIAAETARRLACDASLVAIRERDDGKPLSVGRKTRSIPPSLRRALRARDGGCRFPGCANTRFVDAHHIRHWAHGGETKLDNLVHLCRRHHRLLHEGGFSVEQRAGGELVFRRPGGLPLPPSPAVPRGRLAPVLAVSRRQNRDIDPETCVPRSRGERMDLDLTMEGLATLARRSAGRAPPPAGAG